MNDSPGLPSAIDIEAVECLSHGPAGMTILVTGRWRHDQPEWSGPAVLVIEDLGAREQVPAMPEPPSLSGAAPGTWRMSFSIPPALVARLNGRTWLQLGSLTAPLTLPRVASQPTVVEPDLSAARDLRRYENAARNAWRQAEEADGRVAGLETEIARLEGALAALRDAPRHLEAQIGARERELREAHQQLHAEVAQREDFERRLAARERTIEDMRARVQRFVERERELEAELRRMHRAVDEAHHEAATARTAAERAEAGELAAKAGATGRDVVSVGGSTVLTWPADTASSPPPARPVPLRPVPARTSRLRVSNAGQAGAGSGPVHTKLPPPDGLLRSDVMAGESTVLKAAGARPPRAFTPPGGLGPVVPVVALALEQTLLEKARERWPTRVVAGAEPGLVEPHGEEAEHFPDPWSDAQRRLASLEEGLSRGQTVARRTSASKRESGPPPAPPADVPAPAQAAVSATPAAAAGAVTAAAEVPPEAVTVTDATTVTPVDPETTLVSPVEPGRLHAALERLREAHPPVEEDAESAAAAAAGPEAEDLGAAVAQPAEHARPNPLSWRPSSRDALPRLFRRLVHDDPEAAGRLALQLLPAQRLVHQRPIAYDLVIGPTVCVQLTMGGAEPEVSVATERRPDEQTQFKITGELPRLAKLLAAGPVRRRLRIGLARVRGDRSETRALRALVESAIGPEHLEAAGVRLDPKTALQLIALAIEPAATTSERFTIAHQTSASSPQTATLHVDDGRPIIVGELPLSVPATTTVMCQIDELLTAVLGHDSGDVRIDGDRRPLSLVREWLERA